MLRKPHALSSLPVVIALACGGSSPPPEQPERETPELGGKKEVNRFEADMEMDGFEAADDEVEDDEPATEPGDDVSEAAASDEVAPEPSPEPPAPPKPAGPSRPPSEILMAPKISFMINWPSSAPKEAIEQKCKDDAGEDMAAFAKCRSDARKDFVADVLLFKKEGGQIYWYVYRRERGTLFEVSKSRVAVAGETDNTVTLKVLGGSGARPVFARAREATITVPNDSSIQLDDPTHGKLIYEAKIGLVGN